MRTSRPAALAALAALTVLVAGCAASGSGARPSRMAEEGPLRTTPPVSAAGPGGTGRAGRSAPVPPAPLPGIGPGTLAQVPATAGQAVVVTGAGPASSTSSVTLYRRTGTGSGWVRAAPVWPAHNALHGWTDSHHTGDLRSPIGVYTLTDAGGRNPDPGSRLPYDHAPIGFHVSGTGFDGESLAGAFDYVIAINYNHVPGTSPRDWTRPLGASRGGGIWLHVDHGGPTQGCVSLPAAAVQLLLRTLDPAQHPVVVMGDAASLAR